MTKGIHNEWRPQPSGALGLTPALFCQDRVKAAVPVFWEDSTSQGQKVLMQRPAGAMRSLPQGAVQGLSSYRTYSKLATSGGSEGFREEGVQGGQIQPWNLFAHRSKLVPRWAAHVGRREGSVRGATFLSPALYVGISVVSPWRAPLGGLPCAGCCGSAGPKHCRLQKVQVPWYSVCSRLILPGSSLPLFPELQPFMTRLGDTHCVFLMNCLGLTRL